MELPPLPTLAAGEWFELLFFIILAVFWAIGSLIKNKQDDKETGDAPAGDADEQSHQSEEVRRRLRELAERRRRQLQEMAKKKDQGETGTATASSPRRAESTSSKETKQPTDTPFEYEPVDPQRQQPQAQREQTDREQQRRKREHQEQQRREQEARRQRQRQQQQEQQQEELERQRRLAKKAEQADPIQQGEMGTRGRRKKARQAQPRRQTAQPAGLDQLQLNPQSLRQGIILKELIDKPVGMRDPEENHLNW